MASTTYLSSLPSFLLSSNRSLDCALNKSLGDIHVILGNEAADLDSVISSIVTAFYVAHSLSKEKEEKNKSQDHLTNVFPVINCNREDLSLRTEVTYYLKENGIRLEHLICRNEIDLEALHAGGRLKLTLVDHNVLSSSDFELSSSVHKVIDHHKREKALDYRDIIEPVGSCCTLVAEMVLGLFENDPLVCRLLLGTILLDTVNLSATAQRATSKDVKIVEELESCLASAPKGNRMGRDELFKSLFQARTDISQLTPEQLLRKDNKVLRLPEISIGFPAVPVLSQQLLELPNMMEALKSYLQLNSVSVVIILCYRISEITNEIKRDNIIYSDSVQKAKQVCSALENSELELRLIRSSVDSQSALFAYKQQNVGLSRKFVLPHVKAYFEGKKHHTQNQLADVDALHGVEILMPNGETSPNKFLTSPIPSISYLGVGDPISQGGSAQNSAYNSCPYTPLNSCAEPADGYTSDQYFLPSFNNREMIEKVELKRGKLRGYEKEDDLKPGSCSSYPFTPKNSYVESTLESAFEQQTLNQVRNQDRQQAGEGRQAIDSDLLLRKLKFYS